MKKKLIKSSMWHKAVCAFCAIVLGCSCGNKSQPKEAVEEKQETRTEQKIVIETMTFSEVESVVPAGCSCSFSRNKEEYYNNTYIYADEYHQRFGVMKINGKLVKFDVKTDEGDDPYGPTTATSDEYELEIIEEMGEEGGYESSSFKGTIKVTNKTGQSVEQSFWGICGC